MVKQKQKINLRKQWNKKWKKKHQVTKQIMKRARVRTKAESQRPKPPPFIAWKPK